MTIQELEQAIVDEVAAIDEDLRRRVYGNFQTCLQQCIDVNGDHLTPWPQSASELYGDHLPDVIFIK